MHVVGAEEERERAGRHRKEEAAGTDALPSPRPLPPRALLTLLILPPPLPPIAPLPSLQQQHHGHGSEQQQRQRKARRDLRAPRQQAAGLEGAEREHVEDAPDGCDLVFKEASVRVCVCVCV